MKVNPKTGEIERCCSWCKNNGAAMSGAFTICQYGDTSDHCEQYEDAGFIKCKLCDRRAIVHYQGPPMKQQEYLCMFHFENINEIVEEFTWKNSGHAVQRLEAAHIEVNYEKVRRKG